MRCSERGALLGVGSSLSDQLREESSSGGGGVERRRGEFAPAYQTAWVAEGAWEGIGMLRGGALRGSAAAANSLWAWLSLPWERMGLVGASAWAEA